MKVVLLFGSCALNVFYAPTPRGAFFRGVQVPPKVTSTVCDLTACSGARPFELIIPPSGFFVGYAAPYRCPNSRRMQLSPLRTVFSS